MPVYFIIVYRAKLQELTHLPLGKLYKAYLHLHYWEQSLLLAWIINDFMYNTLFHTTQFIGLGFIVKLSGTLLI